MRWYGMIFGIGIGMNRYSRINNNSAPIYTIPDCWMLEEDNEGAWLWEDENPILLENNL